MEKRVKFDFEIDFTNGGGIQGQDFRLDIEGEDISDGELAESLVKEMRLLMVGEVRILNKEITTEKHKRQPKPQWIYYLQPTRLGMVTEGATSEEAGTVSRHFAYLKDLTDKGVMILMGRTQTNDESTFGIAIFEAEDESAARRIMEEDPAVAGGVMRATLYPYKVALMRRQI
jgi:uncharacterized protein YciI